MKAILIPLLLICLLHAEMSNGQRRAAYNEPCNRLTRCDSRASLTCKRGVCECINPETMTYDSRYGRCSVLAGERCIFTTVETDNRAEGRSWSEEIPCVPSAQCQEGFCSCFPGFYETPNGTCATKKDHREDCETETACRDDKLLICDNKICDCNNTIASYDFQRQMCVRRPGASCQDLQVCVNNAFCDGLTCECESGYFANPLGICERKRGYREECKDDSFCQSEEYTRFVCQDDGRCGCNANISFFDVESNMCRRKAGAVCGDFPFCVENSECGRLREYLQDTSEEAKCDCVPGHFISRNGTCELRVRYGESCEATDHCKKGLVCDQEKGVCQCDLSNSVYDRVKARCVSLSLSPCDETENCITNSECSWGPDGRRQCICKSGYSHSSNGSCLASHDAWCSDDWTYACNHEQGLVCKEGKCTCKFSEFQFFDSEFQKCVSQVNGPCSKTIPCGINSHCSKNEVVPTCVCDERFISVNGECQLTIGQPCNYSTDVGNRKIPKCDTIATLYCIEGICQCPPLEVYDHSLQKCRGLVGAVCPLPSSDGKTPADDFCVQGADCVQRRFHRSSGICKCYRGWTTTKDRKCVNTFTEENLLHVHLVNASDFSSN